MWNEELLRHNRSVLNMKDEEQKNEEWQSSFFIFCFLLR